MINWKYAIGEIIIVTIGISIAFGVNRWGENLKDRSMRSQYTQSLISDLDNEVADLEQNIIDFEQKIASIQQITPYFSSQKAGRDTVFLKIFQLAKIIHFKPNKTTYNTLINSGDLKLFNNFELRKQLEDHYTNQEMIQLDYQRQNIIHEKYLGEFLIYEIDYSKLRQGDLSFMDNKTIHNIIQSLFGSYTIAIESAKKGIEDCAATKEFLQG